MASGLCYGEWKRRLAGVRLTQSQSSRPTGTHSKPIGARAIEKGMVVISLHALHTSFFHPNCAQTGHGDGSKVQGTEGFYFYFFDAPYANSTLEALM